MRKGYEGNGFEPERRARCRVDGEKGRGKSETYQ